MAQKHIVVDNGVLTALYRAGGVPALNLLLNRPEKIVILQEISFEFLRLLPQESKNHYYSWIDGAIASGKVIEPPLTGADPGSSASQWGDNAFRKYSKAGILSDGTKIYETRWLSNEGRTYRNELGKLGTATRYEPG